MKKIACCLMATILILTLIGCSSAKDDKIAELEAQIAEMEANGVDVHEEIEEPSTADDDDIVAFIDEMAAMIPLGQSQSVQIKYESEHRLISSSFTLDNTKSSVQLSAWDILVPAMVELNRATLKDLATRGINNVDVRATMLSSDNHVLLVVDNLEITHDAITSKNTSSGTPAASEPSDTATLGQKNALKKANSYLRSLSFSKSGLIKQLEYEGFSNADAAYAVERCGADWNEQAAKKATSYMKSSSFSKDGLIKQLEYEGFTREQAAYGAKTVGY